MDERLLIQKRIMEDNRRMIELTAAYLNNEPRLVDKELVARLMRECGVGEKQAIVAILSSAFGLDPDLRPADLQFEKIYLSRSVALLDPAVYMNDPYYKNIVLPPVKLGKWELLTECFTPYEGFIYDDLLILPDGTEIPRLGFFSSRFDFSAVLEQGREWMMITPNEINTMAPHIAAAHGKVVTFGLGLGYFTYMVSRKSDVSSVTVVEKDPAVISLFKEYILPRFETKSKINIICADAFSYAEKILPSAGFDFLFADMWHDVSDGLDMYIRLKKLERLSPKTEFSYWIERSLLSELRKTVFDRLIDSPGMTYEKLMPMLKDRYLKALAREVKR